MESDKIGKPMKNMMGIVLKRGFQLAKVRIDRDSEGGREALGMGHCSINI